MPVSPFDIAAFCIFTHPGYDDDDDDNSVDLVRILGGLPMPLQTLKNTVIMMRMMMLFIPVAKSRVQWNLMDRYAWNVVL